MRVLFCTNGVTLIFKFYSGCPVRRRHLEVVQGLSLLQGKKRFPGTNEEVYWMASKRRRRYILCLNLMTCLIVPRIDDKFGIISCCRVRVRWELKATQPCWGYMGFQICTFLQIQAGPFERKHLCVRSYYIWLKCYQLRISNIKSKSKTIQ